MKKLCIPFVFTLAALAFGCDAATPGPSAPVPDDGPGSGPPLREPPLEPPVPPMGPPVVIDIPWYWGGGALEFATWEDALAKAVALYGDLVVDGELAKAKLVLELIDGTIKPAKEELGEVRDSGNGGAGDSESSSS